MLKLIVEDNDYSKATVVESVEKTGGPKRLYIRGICAKADELNRNNRKYRFEDLKKEFDRFVKEDVNNSRAWAEFEHPTDNEIRPERVAAKITKAECDPEHKLWLGEVIVMKSDPEFGIPGTIRGDLLASYLYYSGLGSNNSNKICGFSTRGCGEIDSKTHEVDNFKLITYDVVSSPSTSFYSEGVLESKEFMIDVHGQIVECAMKDYEKAINASARTYDLQKKREICKAAWDTLLSKV